MDDNRQTARSKGDGAQAYVLQRIAALSRQRLHKNALGLMNETINPLWNIDERKVEMIYNWARSGNYAQVQYLYNDIENKDPTLGVCVTRRTSAVAELDWRVVRSDQRLNRGISENLVNEQIECVETAMARIDNMPDALEHLALSAFRGFSAVSPVRDASGVIKHLDCIDGWNLCYDRMGQSWLFNASATSFYLPTNYAMASSNDYREFNKLEHIPRELLCVVTRKREIDWPAMQIFIRAAVGERDWGRFLETYGLPPVIITMPEFTSKEDQEAYVQAAESVFEGRSGVVPYGSNISFASESRGTNPFTEFIEHQQKLIVMMATGGTLATLAESGTGTLAGDAQQDEWKRIIRADKRIISNAINKQICENIIRENFKGQPVLAEFQLDDTPKPTPKEMLELAGAAASAGFEMDAEELSQAIGYKLTKKVEGGGLGDFGGAPIQPSPDNGGTIALPNDTEEADVNAGEVTEPVATNADGDTETASIVENTTGTPTVSVATETQPITHSEKETPSAPVKEPSKQAIDIGSQLVASLQHDFKPVADRLAQVLALPEEERPGAAMKLMQDLDALVSDDPEMAEVIAAEMQKAFDRQIVAQPMGDAPAANKAVPNGRMSDDGTADAFQLFSENAQKEGHWVTMSGQPKLVDGDGKIVAGIKPLAQRCADAKADYEKSKDHPSAEDVADGKIDIATALKRGFEATVGGCHITFYTHDILGRHYEGREGRASIIPKMIAVRSKMQNRGASKGKRVFYPDTNTTDDGRKHVLISDDATGMAISVMKADDNYIQRHFGSWRKKR